MSKRYIQRTSTPSSSSTRPAKRQRVTEFGASNEYDVSRPARDDVLTATTSVSTRSTKPPSIPSLGTLSARRFARAFSRMYTADESSGERLRTYLQALPDSVANRLFDVMKDVCGPIIPGDVIASCFLRGPTIALSRALSHINKYTISAIGRGGGEHIRRLELTGFTDITDSTFASIFPKLPNLRHLSLKGCAKVGEAAVTAAAQNCPALTYVNLNNTITTPGTLTTLLTSCKDLETLKLAAVPKMTQAFLASLSASKSSEDNTVGYNLKNLKVRLITTPNFPFDSLIQHLPTLETLDASWTDLQHLPTTDLDAPGSTYPLNLRKLSLMSVPIKPAELPPFLAHFHHLRVLYLGAIGGSDMPTMTNSELDSLTDVLVDLHELHTISLARNRKLGGLGGSQRELARFVKVVGRRCQVLSLANIPNLKSTVLEGLLPSDPVALKGDEAGYDADAAAALPALLRDLDLSNTAVDDECVPYLASCKSLVRLNLVATKLSGDGVLEIIDGCTLLEEINLEKCRSVDRDHRKRIFEVWEESREG